MNTKKPLPLNTQIAYQRRKVQTTEFKLKMQEYAAKIHPEQYGRHEACLRVRKYSQQLTAEREKLVTLLLKK